VALLELLAGPAGARIVAAHFFLSTNYLLYRRHVSGTRHARLFEFTALAPHESFF
jgi:hypothetical protein